MQRDRDQSGCTMLVVMEGNRVYFSVLMVDGMVTIVGTTGMLVFFVTTLQVGETIIQHNLAPTG